MRSFKFSMLSFVILFCIGCASSPATLKPSDTPDHGKGILLASVTHSGFRTIHDAWFFYRLQGESKEHRLDAVGFNLGFAQNDFPKLRPTAGRLLAVPLEPGQYELSNWMLYVWMAGGYGYISPRNPPTPVEFTISAGTVTYIGGLHIDTLLGKNVFRMTIPVGGAARIADEQARDLPLLSSKFPNLAEWPVAHSVAEIAIWSVQESVDEPGAEDETAGEDAPGAEDDD